MQKFLETSLFCNVNALRPSYLLINLVHLVNVRVCWSWTVVAVFINRLILSPTILQNAAGIRNLNKTHWQWSDICPIWAKRIYINCQTPEVQFWPFQPEKQLYNPKYLVVCHSVHLKAKPLNHLKLNQPIFTTTLTTIDKIFIFGFCNL